MSLYSSIRGRPVWIIGWPHSGWRASEASESGASLLPFDFDITDDGAGGFLLTYRSLDGKFVADSSHDSLDGAYETASRQFDIQRSEWKSLTRP